MLLGYIYNLSRKQMFNKTTTAVMNAIKKIGTLKTSDSYVMVGRGVLEGLQAETHVTKQLSEEKVG